MGWLLYYISLQVAIFFFSQKSSPKEIAEKKYTYIFLRKTHTLICMSHVQ